MNVQLLSCLSCNGNKQIYYLCENRMIPCVECGQTGKVERDEAWIQTGTELRHVRLDAGLSLGETARFLGITPVALSRAERGRQDGADFLAALRKARA